MFEIKIESWEKLVSEFAQELDMSNVDVLSTTEQLQQLPQREK